MNVPSLNKRARLNAAQFRTGKITLEDARIKEEEVGEFEI